MCKWPKCIPCPSFTKHCTVKTNNDSLVTVTTIPSAELFIASSTPGTLSSEELLAMMDGDEWRQLRGEMKKGTLNNPVTSCGDLQCGDWLLESKLSISCCWYLLGSQWNQANRAMNVENGASFLLTLEALMPFAGNESVPVVMVHWSRFIIMFSHDVTWSVPRGGRWTALFERTVICDGLVWRN